MTFDYNIVDDVDNNKWVLNKKTGTEIKSIDHIAVDAVVHDLNTGFFEHVDGCAMNTFEGDSDNTYWSNNDCYTGDEIFRFYIADMEYVLSHLYVVQSGRVIVVAVQLVEEMSNEEVQEYVENAEQTFISVEY